MRSKLYRSSSNQVVSGVCGGIGDYFDIDPTIIRLIWILISLPSPLTSLIVYIACAIIIPEDTFNNNSNFTDNNHIGNKAVLFGCILIIIGISLLLKKLFPWFNLGWYHLKKYWPILLVILGVFIIIKERRNY